MIAGWNKPANNHWTIGWTISITGIVACHDRACAHAKSIKILQAQTRDCLLPVHCEEGASIRLRDFMGYSEDRLHGPMYWCQRDMESNNEGKLTWAHRAQRERADRLWYQSQGNSPKDKDLTKIRINNPKLSERLGPSLRTWCAQLSPDFSLPRSWSGCFG